MQVSLDRFAYGIADPQESEEKVIGKCEGCNDEILDWEEPFEYMGEVLIHQECCEDYIRKHSVRVLPHDH